MRKFKKVKKEVMKAEWKTLRHLALREGLGYAPILNTGVKSGKKGGEIYVKYVSPIPSSSPGFHLVELGVLYKEFWDRPIDKVVVNYGDETYQYNKLCKVMKFISSQFLVTDVEFYETSSPWACKIDIVSKSSESKLSVKYKKKTDEIQFLINNETVLTISLLNKSINNIIQTIKCFKGYMI